VFKLGDKICFSSDYFEGTKSELIEKCGTGVVASEEYDDPHLRPFFRLRHHLNLRTGYSLPIYHFYYINIKWDNLDNEYWEYVDCLSLVEEQEKCDIYTLFSQEMNK